LRPLALAALLAAAPALSVDVFSPGELARPHAGLEGLANCTKCHPAGEQLARSRCTGCHKEVGERIAREAGYHGRLPERERDCWRCHHEHQGRDFPLVDWGEKGRDGFDHAKTGWVLAGKHKPVRCEKCHDPKYLGEPALLDAVAKGRRTYLGAPTACDATCHKDPHENRLGASCDACHTAEGWEALTEKAKADEALHEKTRYPLRGAHGKAACKACHGPARGEAPRWRGLPFAACTDCHADAHVGQLAEPRCDRCHGLDAFLPPRYGPAEHAKSRCPLDGAHRAVACSRCHPKHPRVAERFPAGAAEELAPYGRKPRFSQALLAVAGDLGRCETCHADAHAGQFTSAAAGAPEAVELRPGLAAKPCTACHAAASFTRLLFDHAKDSRYPLEGKHAKASCASCHRRDAGGAVGYRRLPLACEGCHADPHAGTLFQGGVARCERCHGVASWKETRFRHEPPFTEYRLEGKHAKVACERCHPGAAGEAARLVRWRGVPRSCAGCHEDPHRGALRAFAPVPPPGAGLVRAAGAREETRCEACHAMDGWEPKPFAHERTGFTLVGAHVRTPCRACHGEDLARPQPRGCVGCHRDPHQGRLGARCRQCHDEALGWRATFDVAAHRSTDFPLEGRHALLPCEECHGDRVSPGFARPTPACIGCHEADRARTAALGPELDHVSAGFPTRCQQCHSPWRFQAAFLPQHEACFGIASGNHAGVRCFACHDATVEPLGTTDWSCAPKTSHCERCHEAGEVDGLRGLPTLRRSR